MGASRPWPTRREQQDWSFNHGSNTHGEAHRCQHLESQGAGGFDQSRDESGQGRQEPSFSALVVIGDPGAKIVGFGTGKAKEVPAAIKKGIEAAKKNLRKVNVLETTILHMVLGRFGSGLVLLKPAPEGTGVIAGGPVRAVIQAVGITNVLTKSIGSRNPHNVVKATINALEQLRDRGQTSEMRGLAQEKVG